jgi:NADPH-dependent 2,4-dienoyl-CoA reductase/sulfur reductase-like enzyme
MAADGVSPTPQNPGRVVIVGGGLAGFSAAEALRDLGHRDSITIVDAEPDLYDRPPLSKELFDEGLDLARLAFADSEKLAALGIEVRTGERVSAIDPGAASVTLASGAALPADTILLTTGGRARRLSVAGADLPQVHVLRTFSDARAIRDALRPSARVVVVGGGLIGAETAASLRKAGAHVVVVDPTPVPLEGILGLQLATLLHDLHRRNGVELRVDSPAAIEPVDDRVDVVLASGERLPVNLVVVGVGIVPNDDLAVAAGIEVDDGILVDDDYRTSAPRVFAAGDVARRRGPGGTSLRREEHWEAAQINGRSAAAAMLGLPPKPRGASWFWSDRHDVHFEMVGRLVGEGTIVVRDSGEYPATFLVDDGVLVGAASLNDPMIVRAARRIIDQSIPVTEAELADPAVSLRGLLKAGAR